jgi:hypothetical protein
VSSGAAAPGRSWLDRLLAAYPLVVAYSILLVLYAWQSTKHVTPWLFTDELQWAAQSRSIAHHGVPELRLERVPISSLYPYVIAPAWWLGGTGPSYAAAKYIDAAVMAASLFPGYALARLVVSRPAAVVCGIATAAIPAVAYSAFLIPEPLAYFWSTLTLWLVLRAAVRPSLRSVAVAVAALVCASFVRSQLTVLFVAAVVTAVGMAITSARGRAVIARWSWSERFGVAVLVLGALIWAGALANHHSTSWEIGAHFQHRMFTYGLWAVGAFVIGVGVLPAVATLAWLLGSRIETRADRALAALLVGSVIGFGLYTAVKASYLSTNFAIRVEERNLIYLAPLVFAATARCVLGGRIRVAALAVAVAAVGYLLATTPYHSNEKFYSDAPGLSILQWLNQRWYFTTSDVQRLLFGILAGTAVAAVAREVLLRRGRGRAAAVPALLALGALAVGWNLAGEIQAANASSDIARTFRGSLPSPPDWIDQTTRRQSSMVIGEAMSGSDAFWSLEFWNQSIDYVWSVDGTAPPPGRVTTPNYLDTRGTVDPQVPAKWIVAGAGVDPAGTLDQTVGGLRLVRVPTPIRIRAAQGGVTPDGWMSTSSWYYHFAPFGPRRGTALVTLSRGAACGDVRPSHIVIRVSRLRIDRETAQPVAGRLLAVRRVVVRSTPCDRNKVVRIPVRLPFRLDVTATGTFQPSQYDPRQLSAQIGFGFSAG